MILTKPDQPTKSQNLTLRDQFLDLTTVVLPSLGRTKGWTIRRDHEFIRITLDHLFQDCWYNHLDRKLRAYEQLNDTQLAQAVAIAERMREGGYDVVRQMNQQSQQWHDRASTLGPADHRLHGLRH